jgi:hypothetical protein
MKRSGAEQSAASSPLRRGVPQTAPGGTRASAPCLGCPRLPARRRTTVPRRERFRLAEYCLANGTLQWCCLMTTRSIPDKACLLHAAPGGKS